MAAGAKTLAELESGRAAAWTARFYSKSGATTYDIDVVRQGSNMSWRCYTAAHRTNGYLAWIVQTNGLWVVRQKAGLSLWRPYEARIELTAIYSFLNGSQPMAATEGTFQKAQYLKSKDGMALYALRADEVEKRSLESLLAEMQRAAAQMKGAQLEFTERSISSLREKLETGVAMVVDEARGIIRQQPFFDGVVRIMGFEWLSAEDPSWNNFAIGNGPDATEKHAEPMSKWDLNDCVVSMHDPADSTAKTADPSPEPYILNLVSGELRRVPFRGKTALSARFLKDRREVVISSMDPGSPTFVKVNLESGQNEAFPQEMVSRGRLVFLGEVSPDGSRLAYAEMMLERSLELHQARWLELATGQSSNIGRPMRTLGDIAWLPKGDGIVFTHGFGGTNMDDAVHKMVAVMRLDGDVKDLAEGEYACVLRKSGRILYRTLVDEHGVWMTMDFDGNDKKMFKDGLINWVFPAISMDDTKLFFEKRGEPRELTPHVFNPIDSAPRRVTEFKGYFGPSAWR